MRLYTNGEGSWVGTQADARKEFGKDWNEVDVPTDKTSLLEFLNDMSVGGSARITPPDPIVMKDGRPALNLGGRTNLQSCSANRDVREAASLNRYDVADVVLNCPKENLGSALAAIISRLNDQLGEI